MPKTESMSELMPMENNQIATLYQKYHLVILSYLKNRGLPHAVAADLTQEVFMRLMKNHKKLDLSPKFIRPWLYRVAGNLLIDFHRSKRNKHLSLSCSGDHYEEGNNTKLLPAHEVSYEEDKKIEAGLDLEDIFISLNETEILLLSLSLNGFKQKQIGQFLNLTVPTISNRMLKIRKKLRTHEGPKKTSQK